MFIHILDDDLLLNIICLSQPVLLDDDEADPTQILQGGKWDPRRRYKLAHVCRRWRYLVLSLTSHIWPCLVCTYDMPVAGMLVHSPPLPIILDYGDEDQGVTAKDMEGILLALRRRRRVCHIRLRMAASTLRELVVAMDGEFPMLKYLYIKSLTNDDHDLILPKTFKAPRLRGFSLKNIIYSQDLFCPQTPSLLTPQIQSTEGLGQCARCGGSQLWRYALLAHILSAFE